MGSFLYAVKLFIVCYIGLVTILYFLQRKMIYFPLKSPPSLEALSDVYKEVTSSTQEGLKLTHWYSKQGPPYIIVFHGNAGNIESRGHRFKFLADQGYSVLLTSYRGYGSNPGKPTEKDLIDDSSLVLQWLLKEEEISSKEVILFGESLGSAVAIATAEKHPVKALVFDGAFSSVRDIARSLYFFIPVTLLLKDNWDSEKRIKNIKSPLFFIHAKQDSTVPFHFGRKLFNSANELKKHLWLDSSDHDANLEKDGVQQSVIDFIQSVL